MRTKYILHINDKDYELRDDDLKNWEDIKCSYKRSDYGGVVRSFSSQFEFVNKAYDLLLAAYLTDGVNSSAAITVFTQNNQWGYDERFSCPFDFSTISWQNGVLSINGIDNSLAALIKANKSTTYEFAIGTDIFTDDVLAFDRIPMQESLNYKFTQGVSYDDSSDITVSFQKNELPWVGNVASEIVVNGTVAWNDDQENSSGSYLFKAVKDVKVVLDWIVAWRSDTGNGAINLGVRIKRGGSYVDVIHDCSDGNGGYFCSASYSYPKFKGNFNSPSDLPDVSTLGEDRVSAYALINTVVWNIVYNGRGYYWESTGKSKDEYFTERRFGKLTLNLKAGDFVVMDADVVSAQNAAVIRFVESQFLFQWFATGETVSIPVLTPKTLGNALLRKIAAGKINTKINISDFDPRLADTYLMAAESVRALPDAKLYSSFGEFCDWMSTVFGYVYYIGECTLPEYGKLKSFGNIVGTPYTPEGTYEGEVDTGNILYNSYRAKFFYHADSQYFESWAGCEDYNDPETGYPRTDTVFKETGKTPELLWVFEEYTATPHNPASYEYDESSFLQECQTVYFLHRTELFGDIDHTRRFDFCKNLKYSIDTSVIYSTVTVGYDKKDYESCNGRDEFNFNNTYSTGCQVSDKTLSLLSKYRADSYGIEFAVQKRGEDTSDNTSDKDVFFITCTDSNGVLMPDRSAVIENAISTSLFNGTFSPMACLEANAGYIGLQSSSMKLAFASSVGNSSIVIDGIAMNCDVLINCPIATCGCIEFETDEIDMPEYENGIIEVIDNGITYRGFISEVDFAFAKTGSATYKLIVKEVVS